MQYIDVIVPLPLSEIYTYAVSQDEQIKVGCRVVVQFGKKKLYSAIIIKIYEDEEKPSHSDIKEVLSVLDSEPIALDTQLKFWEWIASYYMCTLGEVYRAALPSSLKLESETSVNLNPTFRGNISLTEKEILIFDYLKEDKPSKISDIQKITRINNVLPLIKSLVEKEAVLISEDMNRAYIPKYETGIKLKKDFLEKELHLLLDSLSRAKKQQELLLYFLGRKKENDSFHISKKELLDSTNISVSALDGLIEKNILEAFKYEVSRFAEHEATIVPVKTLNKSQQKAYSEIVKSFKTKDISLIHGITGSGKTEIYIQLIKDTIDEGKQVLYLLPEIALTTQITQRLKRVFGDQLAVYHSRFNDNERAETWLNLIQKEECKIVLGARSAVFLPFNNLGLVIIDEEHESSYKQQDPAPRYNGRNASMFLANMLGAKVLLGTATPSIETYFHALSGKYGFIELKERHENIELPSIRVIDTKELRRKKQMKSFLSPILIDEVNNRLKKKEQIILFQNRRGFAPLLECKTCSWTRKCDHCDVSLTYHKRQHIMVCHYCGAAYPVPKECPECKTESIEVRGYGTERIEEEVRETFPDSSPARMDLDTTRSKKSYQRIISDFELNKNDILIGTQMVSKGLDFENVSLVGILNADNLLNYPDFRAHERAFQMMTQVSGRAGRKNKQGTVILQTSQPANPIIQFVRNNDFNSFFETQLAERRLFNYPPFCRLISIVMRGREDFALDQASKQFANSLRQSFHERVLGPTTPAIGRIQSLYIRNILLKIENNASPALVRKVIEHYKQSVLSQPAYKSILIHFDVDPL